MNKSILIVNFAVLTASVLGMDSEKIAENKNKRQFSLSPVDEEPNKKRMKSNNQDVLDFMRRTVKENNNLKKRLSEEKSRNDKNEKDNQAIMVFLRDISNEYIEKFSEISELKYQKENFENKNTELARAIQKKDSVIKKVSTNLCYSELSKAKPNNENKVLHRRNNELQEKIEELKEELQKSHNEQKELSNKNQNLTNSIKIKKKNWIT